MAINVIKFGATTQNRWRDTIGIQRALNQAKKGPITVYIPPGTYHIMKALKIYKGTTLILDEGATLLRKGRDTLLKNGSSLRRYHGYEGHGYIRIHGGTFDMNGNEYPYNNTAMCLGHAREVEVEGVTVKNVVGGHGIDACGLDGVYIHNCQFLGFYDVKGDRSFSEAIQLDLFVKGAFPKFGRNDGTITKHVMIENCYFGNSHEGNMHAWNRAIGSHASRVDHFYETVVIENNVFDGMRDYALTPLKGKSTFIHNNVFHRCVGGIRYLGVHQGKNAWTLDGKTQVKQGGEGFFVLQNTFIDIGPKDTMHIRSHKVAPHTDIEILDNTYAGNCAPVTLTAIQNITLKTDKNMPKIKEKQIAYKKQI
ncbi:pectate lyase [Staphylococcus muscae]|uniref:Cell wall surface anchor family protein n=1 Tax=Staphylococcus muscae TaxID=1294 RepID=A0A240C5E9_9STAP|nr:glycosyl hydrolase family 28-related protein [Staphylococcus muscae]AVQ33430.1 pectate lyase [Staphylococcus muscae]PNZ04330.1 pectate lyase [Staphylococcus muscae]GGA90110.1 pectate lyase [Staphylococcus muscae]SNW03237.1 cell wall surface anchor family protein [Staphylococcus muscae]